MSVELVKTTGYQLFKLLKAAEDAAQSVLGASQPNIQAPVPVQQPIQQQAKPMKSGIVTPNAQQAGAGAGGGMGGQGIKPMIVNPYMAFAQRQQPA